MKYIVSIIDRSDIDEALYLLATVSEPMFAHYTASVERQAQEFQAAQVQQRLDFEAEKQRQRQEYEQAVQDQADAYAAAQQQHTEHSRQVRQRRIFFYGAGATAGLIAAVVFVMSRVNMSGDVLDPWWLGIGVVMIALIAAGAFTKELPPPVAPQILEPPAPLPPPVPLPSPDPIPLPALPRLAKFYWKLTLAPFENEQWLVIDPQLTLPRELDLPAQDLVEASMIASTQPTPSETDVIRALHKMHQLLTVDLATQRLNLAANDSPLAPIVTMLLQQVAVPLASDELDAPILPGDSAAGPETLRQDLNRVRAFVERPFGMERDGVEILFQTIRAWADRATTSLDANIAATIIQTSAEPATPSKSTLQETAVQASQRLFDELTGELRTEESDLLHQAQQQADDKKYGIEQNIEAKRRRIEDNLASALQRLDDQFAELQHRRPTIVLSREHSQSKLTHTLNELSSLESRLNQTRADIQATMNEQKRVASEHQAAEYQVQSIPLSMEKLTFEISRLEQQITEQQDELEQAESHVSDIANKLAKDEQQLQSVTGAPGMSTQVVNSMRQGVEASQGELMQAQFAVQTAQSQLSMLSSELYRLQQQLKDLELQKNELTQNLSQLASHQIEQQQIFDSKTREVAQLESEFAAAQAAGKIKQIEEEVQFHDRQIMEIDGAIGAVSESKQMHQDEADKKRAELEQARTSDFQQIDEAQASLRAQITQPLQEISTRRDALIELVTTADCQMTDIDLYRQQVEQAIIAYRNEAIQHGKEEIAGAIEKLTRWIDQIRSEYNCLLWTLPTASALPNSPDGIVYFLPLWFAKQGNTQQWKVVAAGRTFAAMSIDETQRVYAQHIAETRPWLNYLAESEIISRYQTQFENHIATFDKDTLKARLDSLVRQQVIDNSLSSYMEQMLTQEISPTTRNE